MKKMDKELIEHIKENLSAHEEAYAPGAWERFAVQEEKKKRRFILWPLWSAAALILIFGALFATLNTSPNKNEIVNSKPQVKPKSKIAPELKQAPDQQIVNEKDIPQVNTTQNNNFVLHQNETSDKEIVSTNVLNKNIEEDNLANQNRLAGIVPLVKIEPNYIENNISINPEKKKSLTKLTLAELLAQDSFNDRDKKTTKKSAESKWEPGLFVAPSMGNDNKVKMNYGFSLSYNIAKKVSVSSGVAYSAISTTGNPIVNSNAMASPASNQAFTTTSSKSLQSIDANVRGINIPLEFKYNISDKLYTGIGISAFAILNNKVQNNYVVTQAENRTVLNTAGYSEQKILIVSERVTEPQAESVIAPEKYLGFYNFSFGYKQKLSPKKAIAVEPFLRLPMKDFSKDNLNLTNGGLRLKLDF